LSSEISSGSTCAELRYGFGDVRRRPLLVLLLACALAPAGLLATEPVALATTSEQQQNPLNDQGSSPNYRSLITAISPKVAGLDVQVLQFSDRLQLQNRTGRTVTITGYVRADRG
jgi:hypothetical protein